MLRKQDPFISHRFGGRTDRCGCEHLLLESGSASCCMSGLLWLAWMQGPWLQAILAGLQSVNDQMTLIQKAGTV